MRYPKAGLVRSRFHYFLHGQSTLRNFLSTTDHLYQLILTSSQSESLRAFNNLDV